MGGGIVNGLNLVYGERKNNSQGFRVRGVDVGGLMAVFRRSRVRFHSAAISPMN